MITNYQESLDDYNLEMELKTTPGYNSIFLPWLNGHRTGWNLYSFNNLSLKIKRIFLYFVYAFFCCIGVGAADFTNYYQIFDQKLDNSLILTLLLKIAMAIKPINNNPLDFNNCWFTNTEADEDYLYVKASKTINGKKKTFRIKAIRLLCGIFSTPSLTKYNTHLQCSHLCFIEPSCVNPNHLCPETDQENKSRQKCFNGCANYCPHTPKCIWTFHTGQILPHRNNTNHAYSITDCDCVDVNCFWQVQNK